MGALDNLKGGSTTTGEVWIGPGNKKSVEVTPGVTMAIATETLSKEEATARYYTDAKFRASWDKVLTANGFGDAAGTPKAEALYTNAVDTASRFYINSKGVWKVTPEEALAFYAKGQNKGGGPKVSVNKYLYQPEEVKSLIDTTVTNFLKRKPTDDEQRQFYDVLKKMIDTGTVTTTKVVGGKTITETKPGYSAEKAKAVIESTLSKTSSQDLQEKQSLDFMDKLSKWGG